MIVHFGTDLLTPQWSASTVCVGTFDGVHLGHQEVIRTAVEQARLHEEPCVLVTFDRHPAHTVAPDRVPPSLATLSQNLERFQRLGVSVAVVLPFDTQMAATTAADFLEGTLRRRLCAQRIVVGGDFAFGKGREGDAGWLSERLPTTVVSALNRDGHRVSSTEIRSLVLAGDVAKASRLLGHDYTLRGIVVPGLRLGRTLGFPTANLALSAPQALPLDGVYGGHTATPSGVYLAASSVGVRPTVDGRTRTVEAFLLGYPGDDLYGTTVDLSFAFRLRDEARFDSLDALAAQMRADVALVARELGRSVRR